MAKETTLKQLYDLVDKKFDLVDKKFDIVFAHLQNIQTDSRQLQKIQREHSGRFDEIDEVLGAVSRAVDKDAVTILAYGRRIARLERAR